MLVNLVQYSEKLRLGVQGPLRPRDATIYDPAAPTRAPSSRRNHLPSGRSVLATPSRTRRLLLGSGSTAYTERADSARGLQVVLVPIVLGMLANAKFPGVVKKIVPFSPVHTMLNA